eukprot:Rmarinus@m.5507
MPKFYCDYCDVFLTHDSASVRKQHHSGVKHKQNVRAYYAQFEEEITQSVIDQVIKTYEEQKLQAPACLFMQAPAASAYTPPGVPNSMGRGAVLPTPGRGAVLPTPPMYARPGMPPHHGPPPGARPPYGAPPGLHGHPRGPGIPPGR